MLRREVLPVYNFVVDVIFQLVAQHVENRSERVAFIVREQVLDVFQHESGRAFSVDDARDIVEKRALRRALETVRTAERILLAYACDAERLARKAGQQQVMRRHRIFRVGHDVADELVCVAGVLMVLLVRLFGELVPFAREDALTAVRLEAASNAADSCKEIDELEIRPAFRVRISRARMQHFTQSGFGDAGTALVRFPASNGSDVFPAARRDFSLTIDLQRL